MDGYITIVVVLTAILISLIGIIGCVLPVLPGPVISYAALLFVRFATDIPVSGRLLTLFGIGTLVVSVLDYLLPLYIPKTFGSSGWGVAGATIGLLVGLFFPPLGFIIGPFIGALILEYYNKRDKAGALVAGIGSFIGFVVGTGAKIALSLAITGWLIVRILPPAIAAL